MRIRNLAHCVFAGLIAVVLWGNPSPLLSQDGGDHLVLRVSSEHFSPNNDGFNDQLFFYPVLRSDREPKRWRLDILRKNRTAVVRLTGNGIPALIKWDGKTKEGTMAPDGPYTAFLMVTGPGLRATAESRMLVDTKSPVLDLSVSTPVFDRSLLSQGALLFNPSVSDASPVERWQLQIIDMAGRTVQVFWSTGPVHPIEWDGIEPLTGVLVPQGNYRCAFQAWDVAGNESSPFFLDLTVNVTAREMLQETLRRLQVNETDLGLVVQFHRSELFLIRKGKPFVRQSGRDLLRELAILINAYPDVPVSIEGYSRTNKDAKVDRERASLYAWSVYSHLIKNGYVKASRLSVRGRGRSAMFDRRTVLPAPLKDGVEVILRGEREW